MPSRRRWTLAATIIGSSTTFVDATVVNVALPALQANLHATMTEVQWIVEAYALFLGGLILVGGSLGDQLGRKRVFLVGVAFFTGASVFCGLARSASALIAGRALQGLGAAFLVPGSLAIISPVLALLVFMLVRALRDRHRSAMLASAAIVLMLLAAVLQQLHVGLHPVWFNHNALYHLPEGIALAMLFVALRAARSDVL